MAKVRMKTIYATAGGVVQPGGVVDVPKNVADMLKEGGYAEDYTETTSIETATAEATETAAKKPTRRKKKKAGE